MGFRRVKSLRRGLSYGVGLSLYMLEPYHCFTNMFLRDLENMPNCWMIGLSEKSEIGHFIDLLTWCQVSGQFVKSF